MPCIIAYGSFLGQRFCPLLYGRRRAHEKTRKGAHPLQKSRAEFARRGIVVTSPVKTVGHVEGRGHYASSTSFPWGCRDRRRRRGAPDAAPQDPSYNPCRP